MKTSALIVLLAALGCGAKAQTFELTGDIHTQEYDVLHIYLFKHDVVDREKTEKVDSCLVRNGRYHFLVSAPDSACWAMVALPPKDNHFVYGLPELSVIMEDGKVMADCQGYTQKLKGGKLNQQYDDMVLVHDRELRKTVDQMMAQRQEKEKTHSYTDAENGNYSKRLSELYRGNRKYMYQFISSNIGNQVGARLFLTYGKDFFPEEFYAEMLSKVNPVYLHRAEALRQAEIDAQKYAEKERKATGAGNLFKDFSSKTSDGKEVRFSDYVEKGKVTLLDFWASWCGPCIQETKDLKALYAEYHAKGLNVVSVSLDTDKQKWLAAVKRNQLPWTHISTLKGFKDNGAIEYAVQAIPYVVLIDRDGRIVLQNKHGEFLTNKIKELCK